MSVVSKSNVWTLSNYRHISKKYLFQFSGYFSFKKTQQQQYGHSRRFFIWLARRVSGWADEKTKICTSSTHVFTNSVTTNSIQCFFTKFYLFTFLRVTIFYWDQNMGKNKVYTLQPFKVSNENFVEKIRRFVDLKILYNM